jgi:glyoxylase-like metal-dependent hydrolase (beta-lactamase superfamily II)
VGAGGRKRGGLLRAVLGKGAFGPERIADGLWRVQGMPGHLNVYFVEDGADLVQFDAGGRCMLEQVREAIRALGRPLKEIVLGHGHTDHRGTAPFLGVPVRCHADEVVDAAGTGGRRYWGDLEGMPRLRRFVHKEVLHPRFWDGGPVEVAGTLRASERVAGFEVVHLPGHAPGQIALVREGDGVALTSDAFYTVDEWGRDIPPRLPGDHYNEDTAAALVSLRRLAELAPRAAWPGHGEPLRGDVREALLAATEAERHHH